MTSPKTVLTVLVLSLLMLLSLAAEPAVAGKKPSKKDRDGFHSGKVYRGSFPDPDVFHLGRLWIAVSTTVAHRTLPMVTSKNGRVWRGRKAHGRGHRRTNDAVLGVPRWAAHKRGGARRFVASWAPSIGRAGHGRWLVAYAAPLRRNPHTRCIGLARGRSALGPFRHSRRPLACARGQNAIDPDLFRTRGRTYLLWKTEGIWGRVPATIWSRPLRGNARGFKPGSKPHRLLRPGPAWEGPVVENPSMIRYHGRLYLFYSGNRWYTGRYAVGYAVCRSVIGPCRRIQRQPLLRSGRGVSGPGGQSAFLGPRGQLLMAYAAWPAGRVGSERRMHIATVKPKRHGRLVVARRFRR